jgi:Ca2+-binding RTX toxin-like protein
MTKSDVAGSAPALSVAIVGFGSAGSRALQVLRELRPEAEFLVVSRHAANGEGFTSTSSLDDVVAFAPDAVIVGSSFNDFIVLQGTGNKAVDGGGGNNVIDGGTGSTFITGGGVGGSDTFFLDGRAPGTSWSTITDFELGLDRATIWGWKEGVSRVLAVDAAGGAEGYTGLTLHFQNLLPDGSASTDTNSNLNSITLSGKTLADFGASSLEELNAQIASKTNDHFRVDKTVDQLGDHGYLYIS